MTFRTIVALLAVVAIAACGGAATEEEVEVVQESPLDDAAAVAAMIDEYVLHYNMGHASMAVDYATDGILLGADGSVVRTAEGRLAGAEAAMEFSPELAITTGGVIVLGDDAVAHGSYSVSVTPEGAESVTSTGNWLSRLAKVDGDWKWAVSLINYDTAPPEGLTEPVVEEGEGSGDGVELLEELSGYYETHFNMGHAGMVASRYADDAVAALSGQPKLEGRAAIEENMAARMEALGNPQLKHYVGGARELGDGFVFGGGRYEMTSDSGNATGWFLVLARPDEDGNLQIHWNASNGLPASN